MPIMDALSTYTHPPTTPSPVNDSQYFEITTYFTDEDLQSVKSPVRDTKDSTDFTENERRRIGRELPQLIRFTPLAREVEQQAELRLSSLDTENIIGYSRKRKASPRMLDSDRPRRRLPSRIPHPSTVPSTIPEVGANNSTSCRTYDSGRHSIEGKR